MWTVKKRDMRYIGIPVCTDGRKVVQRGPDSLQHTNNTVVGLEPRMAWILQFSGFKRLIWTKKLSFAHAADQN